MLGLPAWAFVLVWDAVVATVMLAVMLPCCLAWGLSLSGMLGGLCGAMLAGSVVSLASRDRIRVRAGQSADAVGKRD